MKHLIFPALLGLGLTGCSQANPEPTAVPKAQPTAVAAPAREPSDPSNLPAVAPVPGPVARTVVYEGKLNLAVADFEQASAKIDSLVNHYGGYQASAHESRAEGKPEQDMVIRVPPTRFVPLVAALGKVGHIENKDVASSDISADILDASNGLIDKQTTQAKYQQLLAKTTNPAEVQRLVAQDRQLKADIAVAQARLQQFGAQRTWATLSLHYFQLLPSPAPSEPLPAFAPRFRESFNRGWSLVMGLLVLLTNLWPLLLVGGAGAWGLHRWRLRQQTPA
ncbi:DUF4349 domain-containing protein [Hymenobacter ruricola]|uniref:DUF4349 domain-containing protein n=1 Tax=Hymenobacter ruricola TaxID=2791023 RepID=A0ABS0I1W1_9BACT|nr:DUF4349 domain-containing protein [Hymenobacter ruricola]MBF9220761.1 DUF4349 domain-containing protein [Hymenobacter ruricola]